jgi:hypothetical protein
MNVAYIDWHRYADLTVWGSQRACFAAVVIDADGREDFVIVDELLLEEGNHTYHPDAPDAPHERLGPLPIEYVRRITISRRTHRCGRPTKTTGCPCRIEVTRIGEPCGLHREQAALDLLAEQLGARPVNEGDQPR